LHVQSAKEKAIVASHIRHGAEAMKKPMKYHVFECIWGTRIFGWWTSTYPSDSGVHPGTRLWTHTCHTWDLSTWSQRNLRILRKRQLKPLLASAQPRYPCGQWWRNMPFVARSEPAPVTASTETKSVKQVRMPRATHFKRLPVVKCRGKG
jgi:hypothetical protein